MNYRAVIIDFASSRTSLQGNRSFQRLLGQMSHRILETIQRSMTVLFWSCYFEASLMNFVIKGGRNFSMSEVCREISMVVWTGKSCHLRKNEVKLTFLAHYVLIFLNNQMPTKVDRISQSLHFDAVLIDQRHTLPPTQYSGFGKHAERTCQSCKFHIHKSS